MGWVEAGAAQPPQQVGQVLPLKLAQQAGPVAAQGHDSREGGRAAGQGGGQEVGDWLAVQGGAGRPRGILCPRWTWAPPNSPPPSPCTHSLNSRLWRQPREASAQTSSDSPCGSNRFSCGSAASPRWRRKGAGGVRSRVAYAHAILASDCMARRKSSGLGSRAGGGSVPLVQQPIRAGAGHLLSKTGKSQDRRPLSKSQLTASPVAQRPGGAAAGGLQCRPVPLLEGSPPAQHKQRVGSSSR